MRARLLLIAVAATIALSLGLSAWRLGHRVSDHDLDAAAADLRSRHAAGDLIVVTPGFMAGPRQRLGDLPIIEPRALVPADVLGYARVHLVTLDAIGVRPGIAAALRELGTVEHEGDFGDVTVTTIRLRDRRTVLFDMRTSIPSLKVTAQYADGVTAPCDRLERNRLVCPREPSWSYVGRETLLMDEDPRECVWMHPLQMDGVLRVEWPSLAVPPTARLVGGFGFTQESARRVRAPVKVTIRRGEETVLAADCRPGTQWERFDLPVPTTGSEPFRVEVHSQDNGAAHFCMDLKLVESETP